MRHRFVLRPVVGVLFAVELTAAAAAFGAGAAAAGTTSLVSGPQRSRTVAQAPTPAASASPSSDAVTVAIKPVVGTESLTISGVAVKASAVTVTMAATFSRDLPTVVVARRTIRPDAGGAYSVVLPLAPGYFADAVITVTAAVEPAGATATARWSVGPPNVTVPPDNLPKNVR